MRASLHAAALLAWGLAALGAAAVWDARSTAPGGLLPHTVGTLALLLHGVAFFASRKDNPMSDPNVPSTLPPPPDPSGKLFDELRAALPAAHAVDLQTARLQGRLDQALADLAAQPLLRAALADLRDALAAVLPAATGPEAAAALSLLPEPARTVAQDAVKGLQALRGVLGAFAGP